MLTMEQRRRLVEGAKQFGISLEEWHCDQFATFGALLYETNKFVNLTRIPVDQMVELHFLDSLAISKVLHLSAGSSLLDVGTGAGFPGIPLAIAFPRVHFVLIDGTRKKVEFVRMVIESLALRNVSVFHYRAEDFAQIPSNRSVFDFAVARAVAPMERLLPWLLPFVKSGGYAVAYKGSSVDAELDKLRMAIKTFNGSIERVVSVALPFIEIERKFVLVRKQSSS
ncbi:16S rRNA m(7)G-527 methyltransferase [Chthonomonas calidirosea]|uniref:16S rRNA (guanine(527)-N(7))-methyltransferase RsmG n=1 Tax=Chthonomonas calidirosea TaxID=454171 RepID=UPI0006DD4EAA|nr:16S rRNA (guanine(527)-N(7))-methyltransferase RsmG [Chthonomonas calidirosea]CEK14186.1 16S rRNA m(7)G-527 methyltransferase [Chthonomonas calidirosea]